MHDRVDDRVEGLVLLADSLAELVALLRAVTPPSDTPTPGG